MNVSRSAVARFLECDDVVGHFLGFVGDRHKVAVMSLLNKAFARLTQDAGSWKWGSDGFILAKRPTRERLRLLRANTGSMWVLTDTLMKYCPALVSFYPCDSLPEEACSALVKCLQHCYTFKRTPLLAALEAARAPRLHTLSACQRHVDVEAFPALTNLTLMHDFERLLLPLPPLMTQQLTRLAVDCIVLRGPAMEISPWSLRELAIGDSGTFDVQLTCDLVVRMGVLCPHLISLELQSSVTWTCEEIRRIAFATPLLEYLKCGRIDDNHADHTATDMWPQLESMTIGCGASYVLLCLANPRQLRRIFMTRPTAISDMHLLRALLEVAPPLVLLRMGRPHRDVVNSTRAKLMLAVLAVVGPTLETLDADVKFVDVGRYCPRLRHLYKSHLARAWKNGYEHLQRGCPLLEGDNV
jgi:hypothetical protein